MRKEECDIGREHKAMHEENFMSSWLKEVGQEKQGKERKGKERKGKGKERKGKERKGKERKGQDRTGKERKIEVHREAKEEVSEKRKREEDNEGNETGIVKRRCVNSASTEAFDTFRRGVRELW